MIERFVSVPGADLWTGASGQGVPALLSSGGPGYPDYLASVAAMIDDRAQVIRWEQRGCGRSRADPPFHLADCLTDLEAIRAAYSLERWIVGGHSWGADLALLYALAYPERTLGIICLAGGRVGEDKTWSVEFHHRIEAEGEALPETPVPPNLEVNRQIVAEWRAAIQQPTLFRQIADLAMPALYVYGGRDVRPGWQVAQVAHLLPRARYVELPEAAHLLWFTHAAEVQAELRRFVDALAAA